MDIEKYRLHVKTCGHESDEEPQTSLKECPFCHKKVQDLARHCETCSAGNGHSSPDLSARVSCSFLIRRNRLFFEIAFRLDNNREIPNQQEEWTKNVQHAFR